MSWSVRGAAVIVLIAKRALRLNPARRGTIEVVLRLAAVGPAGSVALPIFVLLFWMPYDAGRGRSPAQRATGPDLAAGLLRRRPDRPRDRTQPAGRTRSATSCWSLTWPSTC